MLAKRPERERAVELRKQGLSYTEIQQQVAVSQASLSLWLRSVALSARQKQRLAQLSLVGQAAGAKARRDQRLKKLKDLSILVTKELPLLSKDPFFMFGLALYWAEGTKQKPWRISGLACVGNSDPLLVVLMRSWFCQFFKVQLCDFQYRLYIHVSADVEKAKNCWARFLEISPEQIAVTYKRHEVKSRHTHNHYIGLIQIRVRRSTWINRRIELWTKGAAQHFLGVKYSSKKTALET